MKKVHGYGFVLALVLGLVSQHAVADSQVIEGKTLRLRTTSNGVSLVFKSKDPNAVFPTIGGANDPSVVGLNVEVFTASQPSTSDSAPAGAEWTSKTGNVDKYVYRGTSPFRRVVLREGRVIALRGVDVSADMSAPLGPVAIRISSGLDTNCAFFDAGTIRKDLPGKFVARGPSATVLADCSDNTIAIALGIACSSSGGGVCGGDCGPGGVCTEDFSGCLCVFDTDPCGDTAPVCNGVCPTGEECVEIDSGLPFASCTCTPIGVTACGEPGDPTCGGACPVGDVCETLLGKFGEFCSCLDPAATCGGSTPGPCPAGFTCAFLPNTGPWTCAPNFCGGTFPACGGGGCDAGESCLPVSVTGLLDTCVCAPTGDSCDTTCGGMECPGSAICTLDPVAETCSCL